MDRRLGVIETLIAMFDGFAFIAAGDSRLFRLSELRCWAGGGMLDAATTGGGTNLLLALGETRGNVLVVTADEVALLAGG